MRMVTQSQLQSTSPITSQNQASYQILIMLTKIIISSLPKQAWVSPLTRSHLHKQSCTSIRAHYSGKLAYLPLYAFCSKPSSEQSARIREEKHRRRVKQLEAQEIRDMQRRVNLTREKYSPLVEYTKIYQWALLSLAFAAIAAYSLLKIGTTVAVEEFEAIEDGQVVKKKKFVIVSARYEREVVGERISRQILGYYAQVTSPTSSASAAMRSLQKLLGAFSTDNYTLHLVDSQYPLLQFLPGGSVLISNSLLRDPAYSHPEIGLLVLLACQLFQQRHHIRSLSFGEVWMFWDAGALSNEVKLRQVYARKYTAEEIQEAVSLAVSKVNRMGGKQWGAEDVSALLRKLGANLAGASGYRPSEDIIARLGSVLAQLNPPSSNS